MYFFILGAKTFAFLLIHTERINNMKSCLGLCFVGLIKFLNFCIAGKMNDFMDDLIMRIPMLQDFMTA